MLTMPKVSECEAKECAYNVNHMCHALAINVGGAVPECDTFVKKHSACVPAGDESGVGACRVEDCQFNECLICTAADIRVKWQMDSALCGTFKKR